MTPEANFAIPVGGAPVGGIGMTLDADAIRRSAGISFWLFEGHGLKPFCSGREQC
jgi:hypothetical protein